MKNLTTCIMVCLIASQLASCMHVEEVAPCIYTGDMAGNIVHYVEINGTSLLYRPQSFDIDNDGVKDLSVGEWVSHDNPVSSTTEFAVNPENGETSILVDTMNFPKQLKRGERIDAKMNWSNKKPLFLYYNEFVGGPPSEAINKSSGNWIDISPESYLGFKIEKKGKVVLGWMRITPQHTVKGYAYVMN